MGSSTRWSSKWYRHRARKTNCCVLTELRLPVEAVLLNVCTSARATQISKLEPEILPNSGASKSSALRTTSRLIFVVSLKKLVGDFNRHAKVRTPEALIPVHRCKYR